MDIYRIKFETDGGPWVEHDYPCPVHYGILNAVYDMDRDIFKPSWSAQKAGWHLIKADNWFKRLVYKLVFARF
jgi:hypothetical protein